MCGIAGIIRKSKGAGIDLNRTVWVMSRAIEHRGPDGEGFTCFTKDAAIPAFSDHTPSVNKESQRFAYNPRTRIEQAPEAIMAFAHRRLSIIDLSEAGHQPMCNATGTTWITYNGEVYNYIELRAELERLGHTFHTGTDTEVILHAYERWGVDCLQKFNGMWAFALYDTKTRQVFCARDRVGVKPFYYMNNAKTFAFASEHKAFLKAGLLAFEIDAENQWEFLLNAHLEQQTTSLFKHIHELPPSHYLVYSLAEETLTVQRYDTLTVASEEQDYKSDEVIPVIREKVTQAIRLRLRSDVEVGSCLSGGIDSSAIAGIIHQLHPEQSMHLFTSIFPGEAFDESSYARIVSEHVKGTWHTVSPTAEEFHKDLLHLNYYQDLPIWSTSTYSQYRVMKLASEAGIKVVLDGQGADEIFSGYTHHYLSYWKELMSGGHYVKARKNIRSARATMPSPARVLLKQYAKDLLHTGVDYSPYFQGKQASSAPEPVYTSLNEQLYHDYAGGRLKSYLKCEDRCSMAFGIESRVPFADDTELVKYLFALPASLKIQKGTLKFLLREAVKDVLPTEVYNRKDKTGFETPQSAWLRSGKSTIIDLVTAELNMVNADRLQTDFETLVNTRPYFVLRLYSLAAWKHVFSSLPA